MKSHIKVNAIVDSIVFQNKFCCLKFKRSNLIIRGPVVTAILQYFSRLAKKKKIGKFLNV